MGVACGHAVCRLRHERAVGVVLVCGAPDAQHTAQRVVAVRLAAITQEVPGGIIAPARDLIRRVIGIVLGARAIDPDTPARS